MTQVFITSVNSCSLSAANLKEQAPFGPLDLHVLGTPPAFVLSQDQTLQKKFVTKCSCQNQQARFSFCSVFKDHITTSTK
ncbi:hypothetical protein CX649_02925 [Bacillaceae bacterium ZC4]|nr:hypothetical protein CX649_02925 [Bacillaceae bacterium ZC4]